MSLNSETAALLLSLIATVIGATWAIRDKMDKILAQIADIKKDHVTHTVCETRRDKCPCKKDIDELRKDLGV